MITESHCNNAVNNIYYLVALGQLQLFAQNIFAYRLWTLIHSIAEITQLEAQGRDCVTSAPTIATTTPTTPTTTMPEPSSSQPPFAPTPPQRLKSGMPYYTLSCISSDMQFHNPFE